jgi:hypothetical protein
LEQIQAAVELQRTDESGRRSPEPLLRRNPLKALSFEQFCGGELIEGDNQDGSLSESNIAQLIDLSGTLAAGLTTIEASIANYARFSPAVQALRNTGSVLLMKSNGSELWVAVDGVSGRAIEFARVAGPSAAQVIMASWSLVVSCSHLIASRDIAQTLRRIERKMDRLVDLNDGDKLGRLEACYEELRWTPLPVSSGSKARVRHILFEIRSVRIGWRRQLAHEFGSVSGHHWWQYFWKGSLIDKDQRRIEEGCEFASRIHLALRMEAVALQMLDETDSARIFLASVAEEAERLRSLATDLTNQWDSDKDRASREQPRLINLLSEMAAEYKEAGAAQSAFTSESSLEGG